MAEQAHRVELTASFLKRLDLIEVLLAEADAAFAFDVLLAELRATGIPNLAHFPRIHFPASAVAIWNTGDIRLPRHGRVPDR